MGNRHCEWYTLWHRYLGDNPEKWGPKITQAELLEQTSGETKLNFTDSGKTVAQIKQNK